MQEQFQIDENLIEAFEEIQQARTPYQLEKFVVGYHHDEGQQYAQCVLEAQIKYQNIRRAAINREKILAKIEFLKERRAKEENKHKKMILTCEIETKKLDLEDQDYATMGAVREFYNLQQIFRTFKKKYTREDLNKAQEQYWIKRLTTDAHHEMISGGKPGKGTLDALRQIGITPQALGLSHQPQADHVLEVEKRYLDVGDIKVLIAIPSEHKMENGVPNLDKVTIPTGCQVKYYNIFGRKVADAYNEAVRQLQEDDAHFLLCVEDDVWPEQDAICKLMEHARQGKEIVGGYYPKRQEVYEGTPIILEGVDLKRTDLKPDGLIHEVYTIPQGLTLIKAEVFKKMVYPYFVTTPHLTQDSFFSQKARDLGYKLYVDTSIRCRHIDRESGEIYY